MVCFPQRLYYYNENTLYSRTPDGYAAIMKKLAITIGDPGGIGPEVVVRALSSPDVSSYCMPVVIGSSAVIREAAARYAPKMNVRVLPSVAGSAPAQDTLDMLDLGSAEMYGHGRPTAEGGRAAAAYVRKAVESALDGSVDGIVTAPISKESFRMAGLPWPGHTEMLAELTGTRDYAMMLVGKMLRVILVTIHAALKDVPPRITKETVLRTIRLAQRACAMHGIAEPKIAVAGLNPHAGEVGMFGDEEQNAIIPAIEMANAEGIPASGPFPPDTVFYRAYRGDVDIVVCMYHDQGLIPLKMIAFDEGVNVTVGLPIIRTSPDHGTAFDIAWQGRANPSSMMAAIRLATELRL